MTLYNLFFGKLLGCYIISRSFNMPCHLYANNFSFYNYVFLHYEAAMTSFFLSFFNLEMTSLVRAKLDTKNESTSGYRIWQRVCSCFFGLLKWDLMQILSISSLIMSILCQWFELKLTIKIKKPYLPEHKEISLTMPMQFLGEQAPWYTMFIGRPTNVQIFSLD